MQTFYSLLCENGAVSVKMMYYFPSQATGERKRDPTKKTPQVIKDPQGDGPQPLW